MKSTGRASTLFGPMRELARIKPPGRSYADTRRFLDECNDAGMASYRVFEDGREPEFAYPIGRALLELWRWCEKNERAGVPFQTAAWERDAAIDRDRDAKMADVLEGERQRATTMAERDGSKRPVSAKDAFNRAREVGL